MDTRPSVVLAALFGLERAQNPGATSSAYVYNQGTGRYEVYQDGARRQLSDNQIHELLTAANRVIAGVDPTTAGQDAYDRAAATVTAGGTAGVAGVPTLAWVLLGAVVLGLVLRRRK